MAGEFYYGATDGSYHDVYVHYGTGALQENDVVYPRSPLKTTTTMDTEAYFDHNKICGDDLISFESEQGPLEACLVEPDTDKPKLGDPGGAFHLAFQYRRAKNQTKGRMLSLEVGGDCVVGIITHSGVDY